MVTKNEYLEALNTVNEYLSQTTKHSFKCSCCRQEDVYSDSVNMFNIEQSMWINGTISKVSFGYGSSHDMETYLIAICDTCVYNLKNENVIKKV